MAVANSGLRLDGEEEGRDEAVDIVDTRCPAVVPQMVQVPPQEEKEQMGNGGRKMDMRRERKAGLLSVVWVRGLGLGG